MYTQISPTILQKAEETSLVKQKGYAISRQSTETIVFDTPELLAEYVSQMQTEVDAKIEALAKQIDELKSRPVVG